MIYTLKTEKIEVFIKKIDARYWVNIRSNKNSIWKEFNTRLELVQSLENCFAENAFYKIP